MRAFSILILVVCGGPFVWAKPPSFHELYDVLRTNLAGVDEKSLDHAAAAGLLEQFKNKVSLVEPAAEGSAAAAPITRSRFFENDFGYIRIGTVNAALPEALAKVLSALDSTNHLKGLVLDLRFSDGHDYAAVPAVAGQFLPKAEPVLDYGEGMKKSEGNAEALRVPVAVLINGQTARAAEALAAALREAGRALILGTTSAGQAYVFEEKKLTGGQTLRVAVAPVKLGSGKELSEAGVAPDLAVPVARDQEMMYFKDPFALTDAERQVQANKNARRMSEADLVRLLRENQDPETPAAAAQEPAPVRNVVRDPALGRALDVLKGLAVVQQSRTF